MKFVILILITILNPAEHTVSSPMMAASKQSYATEKECKSNLAKKHKSLTTTFADKYEGHKVLTMEKCLTSDDAQALIFSINNNSMQKPDDKGKL